MKIYRNIVHYALSVTIALSTLFTFSACDLLEEKTYNLYDLEGMLSNTRLLEMTVNGVYETFSDQTTYGQYWMVYDCDTDISHIQGSTLGHAARDVGHYNVYNEHSWLQESWAVYYQGINRANTIIEYQHYVEIGDSLDQVKFNTLIAETHCLRAMCYFDLVLLFGDVPLKLKPTIDDEDVISFPRTDRKLVFDQILKDFEIAAKGLKYHSESASYTGRLTKGAALGLYARANLFRAGYFLNQNGEMERYDDYMDYYQNVIDITDELIQSGKHALLSSYEQVFRNMCELKLDPTENLWEVPFFNASGQKKHSSMMGTYNGPSINIDSSYGRANSFIKTHGIFYNTYLNLSDADNNVYTDTRRKVAIATFQINKDDEIKEINENQSYNWAPGKWRRNWQTATVKDNNNTDVNWLLIRYADVLLMRAEAENEVNGITDVALEYLNKIRRRAYGLDADTPNTTIDRTRTFFMGSKDDFREEIIEERAKELCFEGLRRMDLIRWNKLGEKIAKTAEQFAQASASGSMREYKFTAAEKFTTGKHELYPIPARERRENGLLTQNPGY